MPPINTRQLIWRLLETARRLDHAFSRLIRLMGVISLPLGVLSGIWLGLLPPRPSMVSIELIRAVHVMAGIGASLVAAWLLLNWVRKVAGVARRSRAHGPRAVATSLLGRVAQDPTSVLEGALWAVLAALLLSGLMHWAALYHGGQLPGLRLGVWALPLHELLTWYFYTGCLFVVMARGRYKVRQALIYLRAP